eukprot:gene12841-biopygen62
MSWFLAPWVRGPAAGGCFGCLDSQMPVSKDPLGTGGTGNRGFQESRESVPPVPRGSLDTGIWESKHPKHPPAAGPRTQGARNQDIGESRKPVAQESRAPMIQKSRTANPGIQEPKKPAKR